MNNNNYINLVQEYYQKNKIKPGKPNYNFICGGPDHIPVWQCTITLFDQRSFTGQNDVIKSKAKLNAAELAYNYMVEKYNLNSSYSIPTNTVPTIPNTIQNSINSVNIEYQIDYNTITRLIIIDLENYPHGNKLQSDVETGILGFLSHSHALYEKLPLPNIKCHVIKSTRKDAADQYMVFIVGQLLAKYHKIWLENELNIKILSKDNFAGVLCDIIRQEYYNIKVEHITSLRDV